MFEYMSMKKFLKNSIFHCIYLWAATNAHFLLISS